MALRRDEAARNACDTIVARGNTFAGIVTNVLSLQTGQDLRARSRPSVQHVSTESRMGSGVSPKEPN